MIEGINLTLYTMLCVLLYLFILLYSVININVKGRLFYNSVQNKLCSFTSGNKSASKFFDLISGRFIPAMRSGVNSAIKQLHLTSSAVEKLDNAVSGSTLHYISESVTYAALTARKLYEGNFQAWIIYSAFAIVAFYFILTVF